MPEWWNSLDIVTQILYFLTIPASLILIIQTLLTIIGFGDFGSGINPSDVSGLDLEIVSGTETHTGTDGFSDLSQESSLSSDPLGNDGAGNSGSAGDGSGSGDFSALRLFTFQGIIALLTVFGWTSIILYHATDNLIVAMFAGIAAGMLAMYGVARLVLLTRKLTSSGNISLKNALGSTAKVYIPIEPGRLGKVTLIVQERFIEADALSNTEKTLTSGTIVRVIDIHAGALVVEEESSAS